jgi:uncharacterized membrane-anchored protein
MIGSVVRSVVAVLLGLSAAIFFAAVVEGVSSILHPFPPGVDPTNYDAVKAHVARYPAWVLLLVVPAWGLGTFVSAWLATRLGSGRHLAHGIVVGSILLVAAVANMLMLPYPVWFWVANLVMFPLGFTLGARLGQSRSSTAGRQVIL